MSAVAETAGRQALVQAFAAARKSGDVEAMADAAFALAADRTFGAPLGSTPAYLHEAYARATGALRVRLAAELARTWVYGGEASRAVPFAREAVEGAEAAGDPVLLAAALDAQLAATWGPDDLVERVRVTQRLEEVCSHVVDVQVRLSAHLWRLTTALETLDVVTVQRQLRALDALGEDTGSPRVVMFAASRRAMRAVMLGDTTTGAELVTEAERAGARAGEPDTEALAHELSAVIALQRDDRPALNEQAQAFEAFGTAYGVRVILAEAALLWAAAGSPERARPLLDRVAGGDLGTVPRDLD